MPDTLYVEEPVFEASLQEIKSSFEIRGKNPKKIKTLENHGHYMVHHRNEAIKNSVNKLFKKYHHYLDSDKEKFIKKFQSNYGELVFELVAAEFFSRFSSLKPRSIEDIKIGALADLEFEANGKLYYLDCTTRSSSLIPDYLKMAKKFADYLEVARVLHKKDQQWFFNISTFLVNAWDSLDLQERVFMAEKFGNLPICDITRCPEFLNFEMWIFYVRYILLHYPDLFPESYINELNNVGLHLKVGMRHPGPDGRNYFKTLARFVAQSVVDKLTKEYFTKNIPVIVFVSLALLNDVKMMMKPKDLFDSIANFLSEAIDSVVQERLSKCKDLQERKKLEEKFIGGLGALYAIMVDTTWYNWGLGDDQIKMPDGYDNYYGILYNSCITEEIEKNSDKGVFDSRVPYKVTIALKI